MLTLAASVHSASAAASTWLPTTASTFNWSDPLNWSAGVPNGLGAVANLSSDLTGNQTVTLDQNVTLSILNIGDTGSGANSSFTLNANTLTFAGADGAPAAINVSTTGAGGDHKIYSAISAGSDLTITNNGPQVLSINGTLDTGANTVILDTSTTIGTKAIAGTGTLIKNGKGTINNQGVSTHTGPLVINAGGYIVTGGATSGSLSSLDITVNANAQSGVAYGGSYFEIGSNVAAMPGGRVADAAVITLKGGGLSYKGSSSAGTTTEVIGGIVAGAGNSNLTISAGSATQSALSMTTLTRESRGTLQVRGTYLGGAVGTVNTTRIDINTAPTLVGAGGAAGSTSVSIVPWVVSGTNTNSEINELTTYDAAKGLRPLASGEYAAFSSALATDNASGNGGVSDDKTVNALKYTYSIGTIASGKTLTITSGALLFANSGGGLSGGTINFGAAEGVIWSIGTNTNTISSAIAGSNGITKAGTGILTLSGQNIYTGVTTVSGGVLRTGAANTLSSSSAVFLADSTVNGLASPYNAVTTALDLNGFSQTIGSLAGGGAFGGNVLLGTATLTTGGDNSSTNYGGNISGAGGLTKEGTGTFTLSGSSTYTGATAVNSGKLAVSGAVNSTSGVAVGDDAELNVDGSITASVALSGKLSGSGNVGSVIATGGIIAPGNSIGTLATDSLSIDGTSILDIELGRDGGSAVSDQVDVTGSLSLISGAELKLTLYTGLTNPENNDVFFLVLNDLDDSVSGAFTKLNGVDTNLSEGSQFTWNSQQWVISYTGDFGSSTFQGAGNDIAIMVVPEPSTWAMMVGGLASLLWLQCGKRRASV